jgi:hypothetical protein
VGDFQTSKQKDRTCFAKKTLIRCKQLIDHLINLLHYSFHQNGEKMTKGLKIGLIVTSSFLGALLLIAAGFFIGRSVITHASYGTLKTARGDASICNRWEEDLRPYGNQGLQEPRNKKGSPLGVPPGIGEGQPGWFDEGPLGDESTQGTTLTLDSAKTAVDSYLARLNNSDLKVAEIILFHNSAYARVIEQSTGRGAMELLMNGNGRVTPEMGANRMWNLKYGHMRFGVGGDLNAETPMSVTSEQALSDAQKWLDEHVSGTQVAATADAFYGYYTIEYTQDGKIAGMVSVNGFSGDIFPHTWHGTFLDMKEY